MKRISALLLVCVVFLSGCAFVGAPMVGGIATATTIPLTATSNNVCEKVGKAKCHNVLGIAAFGDCSIAAAKKNGGITEVSSVDVKTISALIFYASYETIVCGK